MIRRRLTLLARFLVVAAALVCGVGMMGPFQGAEEAFVPWDKAAHFIAFYGFTILLFASFPYRRRIDLALIAVLAGAGVEVVQQLTGRDGQLGDVLADTAGALAVIAPLWVERLRSESRRERRRSLAARMAAQLASARRRPAARPPAALPAE
jgi:VanZ family protein